MAQLDCNGIFYILLLIVSLSSLFSPISAVTLSAQSLSLIYRTLASSKGRAMGANENNTDLSPLIHDIV